MNKNHFLYLSLAIWLVTACNPGSAPRKTIDFNEGWSFRITDDSTVFRTEFDDGDWRTLNLPHDWSIEGAFDSIWPAGNGGGALPGGIGWYRKKFKTEQSGGRSIIEFDGIYRNSEVWINEHYLGKWPYGYSAFHYDLTPWLKPEGQENVLAVRVDNSEQPNSRWYSGSGIYRDVKLILCHENAIRPWGVFVTTPEVNRSSATVAAEYDMIGGADFQIKSEIRDADGNKISEQRDGEFKNEKFYQTLEVTQPRLWSVEDPYLYSLVTRVFSENELIDEVKTTFGIRYFEFDAEEGFSLNGEYMKILGVCEHHDLGALGAAFNTSAARRQLRILKEMGVNAIRMAHNPPAAKLLDLCDEMGFLVMDETFDVWAKKKTKFDYHRDFPEWYEKDVKNMVLRDRNHPSVIMWSIGNEIREQFDSTGIGWAKKLADVVKRHDDTRPVTSGLTEIEPENYIFQSGAIDVFGVNYKTFTYADFQEKFPGVKMIASENVSGLASRGDYDMPADSMRYWPPSSAFKYVPDGNEDFSVSAYDNVSAYWGSSHEDNWKHIKKHSFVSGVFVWSGFDFLGEPVPYPYPARSSYYGIVDLAGFPKDVYYMYQSEWTTEPVLHVFPHWNWEEGDEVDVKAYYNEAEEVELLLNGRSLGRKSKTDSTFHVLWKVPYEPGELKAVSYKAGEIVLEKVVRTAGEAYKLEVSVENKEIDYEKNELAFLTVRVLDKEGNLVPDAGHLVTVEISGPAAVEGMDNGYPADLSSLRDAEHNAYNGLVMAMIRGERAGEATVKVSASGLVSAETHINIK